MWSLTVHTGQRNQTSHLLSHNENHIHMGSVSCPALCHTEKRELCHWPAYVQKHKPLERWQIGALACEPDLWFLWFLKRRKENIAWQSLRTICKEKGNNGLSMFWEVVHILPTHHNISWLTYTRVSWAAKHVPQTQVLLLSNTKHQFKCFN